jgi:hypothetical protein
MWNGIPSEIPYHSVIKVKNTTTDINLGYGCYWPMVRQVVPDLRHIVTHMKHDRLLGFPIKGWSFVRRLIRLTGPPVKCINVGHSTEAKK